MLNHIRHYERLTMLRRSHLTGAPISLRLVHRSTCCSKTAPCSPGWLTVFIFLNEDGTCHKAHWNPWCLAPLGSGCPASILSRSFIAEPATVEADGANCSPPIAAHSHLFVSFCGLLVLPWWRPILRRNSILWYFKLKFLVTGNLEIIVYFPTSLLFSSSLTFCTHPPWDH